MGAALPPIHPSVSGLGSGVDSELRPQASVEDTHEFYNFGRTTEETRDESWIQESILSIGSAIITENVFLDKHIPSNGERRRLGSATMIRDLDRFLRTDFLSRRLFSVVQTLWKEGIQGVRGTGKTRVSQTYDGVLSGRAEREGWNEALRVTRSFPGRGEREGEGEGHKQEPPQIGNLRTLVDKYWTNNVVYLGMGGAHREAGRAAKVDRVTEAFYVQTRVSCAQAKLCHVAVFKARLLYTGTIPLTQSASSPPSRRRGHPERLHRCLSHHLTCSHGTRHRKCGILAGYKARIVEDTKVPAILLHTNKLLVFMDEGGRDFNRKFWNTHLADVAPPEVRGGGCTCRTTPDLGLASGKPTNFWAPLRGNLKGGTSALFDDL
ncbi:hypothetical protein EI94DRAFT_1791273 [Lactarius quietus]|nr:hypothetical protein EI94DRAFT_1791273 [Lactarius quietus]